MRKTSGMAICLLAALVLASLAGMGGASQNTVNVALAKNGASVIGNSPINDGIVTGYTGSSGFSWFYWPGSMTIVLPKAYTIDRIKTLLWDGDGRYYQYYLEVSGDGVKWTKVVDKTFGQWKSWQLDTFEPVLAKYIKITGTFNSANEGFHIVELEAYASTEPIVTPLISKSYILSIKKIALPYSTRQFQETTIKVSIENSGISDVTAIEVMDSIHSSFDLVSGDFPNPKKYDIIRQGESRDIQYIIRSKESGTFTLEPATVTYADKDGNIQEVKSEPVSIKVIPSSEGSTGAPSGQPSKSASVNLHGEKTDVVLGEDILLKLSAVNLITKPKMHVQVIIIPPSGMSVTSSEFSKSGAGQFTANYELAPGDGRDIEVRIRSNQVGDFNVNGRIIYYFGDETDKAEDYTLNLPIKVRKEAGQAVPAPTSDGGAASKTPGFAGELAIIGILFVALFIRRRKI